MKENDDDKSNKAVGDKNRIGISNITRQPQFLYRRWDRETFQSTIEATKEVEDDVGNAYTYLLKVTIRSFWSCCAFCFVVWYCLSFSFESSHGNRYSLLMSSLPI